MTIEEKINKKVMETIDEHNLIVNGDKIVVGLSGGPDSLSLINILLSLREKLDIEVCAVHVNHLFRGKDADDDEEFVKTFCAKNSIDSHIYRYKVEEMSKEKNLSFEEMGRILRYGAFEEVMAKAKYNKIAVAQNRNDIVETFFINAFRGSGIEGLKSIDYRRGEKIIRPLLAISREEIEEYCEFKNLKPRIDKTNSSLDYTRNRIRNQLIPHVKEYFNPNIEETLFKTTELLKDDNNYFKEVVRSLYSELIKNDDVGQYMEMDEILNKAKALQGRLLFEMINQVKGNTRNISYSAIKRVIELKENNSRVYIDKENYFLLEYNKLYLLNKVSLKENEIAMEVIDLKDKVTFNQSPNKVYIDASKIKGSINIRNRRPGDGFKPLGMTGTKKLKDFFMDQKIPNSQRNNVLLVCDDDNIVWVSGYRISEEYKVDKKTKEVIVMYLVDEG